MKSPTPVANPFPIKRTKSTIAEELDPDDALLSNRKSRRSLRSERSPVPTTERLSEKEQRAFESAARKRAHQSFYKDSIEENLKSFNLVRGARSKDYPAEDGIFSCLEMYMESAESDEAYRLRRVKSFGSLEDFNVPPEAYRMKVNDDSACCTSHFAKLSQLKYLESRKNEYDAWLAGEPYVETPFATNQGFIPPPPPYQALSLRPPPYMRRSAPIFPMRTPETTPAKPPRKRAKEPRPLDASEKECSSRFSREDRDFVTPWYTYAQRFVMFLLGPLIIYFIYWRFYNYPRSGIWWHDACAYIFISSEAICFLFGMTHWVWMWNLRFRKRVTQEELNLTDEDLPTIDIMIPCYSEPTEIVEMTLKACYDMDYPAHKITCYICDDGKKERMKKMTERIARHYTGAMQTKYVARSKIPGVPHHAKAGNLNNCILNEGSTGQLIIILDCDMLPEPCMARTVAPFFYHKLSPEQRRDPEARVKAEFDHTTGLLQTPQAFYNLDTNDLLGQSYSFFYECFMSGWDGTGCTPCCGTGVTFSRTALTAVGGFSTGSITEDFKTSLNLCAHGYKCKYFLQRMTRGVSPKDLEAFMVQRMRWAVGAIQIFRAGNPLFIKGLPYRARWLYFFSTVGIVYIIPVCFMGLIMYLTILFGVSISFGPTTFTEYLYIGGTAVFGMMVMQYLAGWRISRRDYLRALQDNFTVFWTLIRAILTGFLGLELGFKVTEKKMSFDLWANLRHAAPHICVYLLSTSAIIKGTCEMMSQWGWFSIPWTTEYNVDLLYFSIMWTVFLWVMVSSPPRMVYYGWKRARRERKNSLKCANDNVPALQELPVTPMNTFPPLDNELWKSQGMSLGQSQFLANLEARASASNLVTVPETDATTSITPRAAAPKM